MKQSTVKNFGIDYKKFVLDSYLLLGQMREDTEKFAEFGVTSENIDSYEALRKDFQENSHDEIPALGQHAASNNKKELSLKLSKIIYYMQLKSKMAAEESEEKISLIQVDNITALTFDELRTLSESYLFILTKEIENLSYYGLNQEDYDGFKEKTESFSQSFITQGVAKINRKLATQKRTKLANKLYAEYTKYSYLGKKMWALTDYVKSKSYVIYKKSKVKSRKP